MHVNVVVSGLISQCKPVWKLTETVLLFFHFLVLIVRPYFLLAHGRRKLQLNLVSPPLQFPDRVGHAGVLVPVQKGSISGNKCLGTEGSEEHNCSKSSLNQM